MNLIEQAVKQADTVYREGQMGVTHITAQHSAAAKARSIEDAIMDEHLEMFDFVAILDAMHKKFWTVYGDQYPKCLDAINDCRTVIDRADMEVARDIDPMDQYRDEDDA